MLSKICFSVVLMLCPIFLFAQEPPKPTPTIADKPKDDEVLRVNTNLIQTGITVVDKKGNFVDGLKQDDFVLRVDGKPVPTLFFDQISIKNPKTEGANGQSEGETSPVNARDPVRTLVFVVDDMHLSIESLIRTRIMILKFIDEQMMATDRIAIVSSGGKVGFLQQFTSNKAMLRAAANRLVYSGNMSSNDPNPPPMSEYEAKCIDRLDRDVLDLFIKATMGVYHLQIASQANSMVQARVRAILGRARMVTSTTLAALEASVRQAGLFRGRKAVYFITDGFLVDQENSDTTASLQKITDSAARSNTVIYSFDAKGLDASLPDGVGGATMLGFALQAGGRQEVQDGPAFVANNTGGQFIHNMNDLQSALNRVTNEAFTYYLLAWEPEAELSKNNKFKRIEFSVKGRPELKVRVQNGYLSGNPFAAKPVDTANNKSNEKNDKAVATQPVPRPIKPPSSGLSTTLALSYLDLPDEGASMSATIQVNTDGIDFVQTDDISTGNIEISGVILDGNGKQVKDFKEPVDVRLPSKEVAKGIGLSFNYDHKELLKPGLYRVNITTRDVKNGKTGNSFQWIEIPDLSTHKLALSTLLLGERKNDSGQEAQLERNIGHQFERTSSMRYLGFIYNGSAEPDVSIEMQILRQRNVVVTSPGNVVTIGDADPERIPYSGEIPLKDLSPGHYELKIIVTDKKTKKAATQQTFIEVT